MKTVLVEDHLMFLQLLNTMVQTTPGLEVVATARSQAEGIAMCQQYQPDLLVLDLALPDGSGTEVARVLLREVPGAHIIILSGETSMFVCPPDLAPSVAAVVKKTEAFEVLDKVVRRLVAASDPTRKSLPVDDRDGIERLTSRERQIFVMIGRGLLSKEIGEKLGISPQTVQVHRKSMARKLGTVGPELTQRAFRYYQAKLAQKP